MFERRYFSSEDFDGEDLILEIQDVKVEDMGNSGDKKPVLYFKGQKLGLALNKTNYKRLQKVHPFKDTDELKGKLIAIYFDEEVEYKGEVIGGIRVRAKAPATPFD
jgi:hypothetical protein